MRWNIFNSCMLVLCTAVVQFHCQQEKCYLKKCATGLIGDLINKTMESLRTSLTDLYITHRGFETGPQEFGEFSGHIHQVIVRGLNNFHISRLNTTLLNINNMTIVVDKFSITGLYNIDGTLAFPLGNDIHLYGKGEISGNFTNLSISTKLKIHYLNGKKIVKDLDVILYLEKMKVYLKNLMDGGHLESTFNQLINDVGMTVFNYYKKPILDMLKTQLSKIITDILNPQAEKIPAKEEL